MTTTGATEAVTPEQRAQELCYEAWPAIAQALREAEANALRRAIEHLEEWSRIIATGDSTAKADTRLRHYRQCIDRIRSLLPKEEGQAPDAPR